MIYALNRAGFDELNDNHMLIVLGDAFDRGDQNLELANYLVRVNELGTLQYIMGNHDIFLLNYVTNDVADAIWNARKNGMDATVEQISGVRKMESWYNWLTAAKHGVLTHPIITLLADSPLWFENDKFIYAHAGIPNTKNWRDVMDLKDTGMRTDFMFEEDLAPILGGKQLIVGHWHACLLRAQQQGYKANYAKVEQHITYYSDDAQKIAIDGCSNYSGFVNVHVYDDRELDIMYDKEAIE